MITRDWTPSLLSTVVWWLDASDADTITIVSGAVSQWADKSGNAKHATQGTAASRPVVSAASLNGLDTVFFDGSKIMSTASAVIGDDSYSLFAVVKAAPQNNKSIVAQHDGTAATGRTVFLSSGSTSPYDKIRTFFNNGTSYVIESTTSGLLTSAAALMYSESNGSGRWVLRVNGGPEEGVLTGQTLNPLITGTRIGGTGSTGEFAGYIGEIVVVSPVLSSDDRQRIEGYLAHQWGTTASLPSDHPYKTSAPTVSTKELGGNIKYSGANVARGVQVFVDGGTTAIRTTTSNAETGDWHIDDLPDNNDTYTVLILGESGEYSRIFRGVSAG